MEVYNEILHWLKDSRNEVDVSSFIFVLYFKILFCIFLFEVVYFFAMHFFELNIDLTIVCDSYLSYRWGFFGFVGRWNKSGLVQFKKYHRCDVLEQNELRRRCFCHCQCLNLYMIATPFLLLEFLLRWAWVSSLL